LIALGSNGGDLAAADFDGDGRCDLAVALSSPDRVSIFRGGAGGSFPLASNTPLPSYPIAVAAGDLNADGSTDLAVVVEAVFAKDDIPHPDSKQQSGSAIEQVGSRIVSTSAPIPTYQAHVLTSLGQFDFSVGPPLSLGASDVAIADFNDDGTDDLAVSRNTPYSVDFYLSHASRRHELPARWPR